MPSDPSHPVLRWFRRLVIAGVVLAILAPVAGSISRTASIAVYVGAGLSLATARTVILYRAGYVPPGLDGRHLRRLRFWLAVCGTPLLLCSFLITVAAWSLIR